MSSTDRRRAAYKKINKKRKEYFKEYYDSEKGDKNRERAYRNQIMQIEAGHAIKIVKDREKKRKKQLDKTKLKIVVDGRELWKRNYALFNMINNISKHTMQTYIKNGWIPEPIYVRKTKMGRNRYYISKRQIQLINRLWHKGKQTKTRNEKIEYLHAHWTEGELGF
jgi:uncharacterized protein YneR